MNLDKKQLKTIVLLMALAGLILWIVLNVGTFAAGISKVLSLLNPLIVGMMTAYILNILLKKVEGLLLKLPHPAEGRLAGAFPGLCRAFGIIISVLLLGAILTLVVGLLIPSVREAWSLMVAQFPACWEKLQEISLAIATKYGLTDLALPDLSVNYEKILEMMRTFFTTGFTSAVGFMSSVVSVVLNGILGFVFAIYILSGKETLAANASKVIRAYAPEKAEKTIFYVAGEANRIFSGFIVGQVTDAAINGMLCFLGMLIFGFPYRGMIAILVGFTALIPIFGAFIGTVVGALLILMTSPVQAVGFVIMVVVLQQIDGNLIYPRVVGNSMGLPAIWTLLAVLVGGSAGGILGMLFGVPLAGLLYTLLRRSVNGRLERKELAPVENRYI